MSRPCTVTGCPNTTRRGSGRCPDHRYADRNAREPAPPPAEATARAAAAETALRTAFGADVRIESTAFVSGAVALQVHDGRGVVSVLGTADGDGWSVSGDGLPRRLVADVDGVLGTLRERRPHTAGRQSGHDR